MYNKIYKKHFLSVNANQLNHHTIPMLSKDKPNTAIIYVGVNDMMNRTDHNDLILQINRTGFTWKNYGVKNVI